MCVSTANMLDAMLLRNGGRSSLERRGVQESSTLGASAPSMLWCHCYHHCPEDSVNNTCM